MRSHFIFNILTFILLFVASCPWYLRVRAAPTGQSNHVTWDENEENYIRSKLPDFNAILNSFGIAPNSFRESSKKIFIHDNHIQHPGIRIPVGTGRDGRVLYSQIGPLLAELQKNANADQARLKAVLQAFLRGTDTKKADLIIQALNSIRAKVPATQASWSSAFRAIVKPVLENRLGDYEAMIVTVTTTNPPPTQNPAQSTSRGPGTAAGGGSLRSTHSSGGTHQSTSGTPSTSRAHRMEQVSIMQVNPQQPGPHVATDMVQTRHRQNAPDRVTSYIPGTSVSLDRQRQGDHSRNPTNAAPNQHAPARSGPPPPGPPPAGYPPTGHPPAGYPQVGYHPNAAAGGSHPYAPQAPYQQHPAQAAYPNMHPQAQVAPYGSAGVQPVMAQSYQRDRNTQYTRASLSPASVDRAFQKGRAPGSSSIYRPPHP
ncbi:hypothetical protein C8Q75DRAFT_839376 [Abortiporus biennis]|nr:hypothetical protein C8Q75DRAFT_839376 [Abortiporus biennis]